MAKYSTRRILDTVVRLVGRASEDYAQELQEWIERIHSQVVDGIPSGFNEEEPTQIQAGVVGDPGNETAGWMAADAILPIETDDPVSPGITNDEGTGTALARADHIHDIFLRQAGDLMVIKKDGATIVRFPGASQSSAGNGYVLSWNWSLDPPLEWVPAGSTPSVPTGSGPLMGRFVFGLSLPYGTAADEFLSGMMMPDASYR